MTRTTLLLSMAVGLIPYLTTSGYSQVVQLPTMGSFSLDTSVMVPDRGSTSLGGVGRSSQTSSRLGPASPQLGASRSTTQRNSQVAVTIIDLEELEQELRQQTIPQSRSQGFGPSSIVEDDNALARDQTNARPGSNSQDQAKASDNSPTRSTQSHWPTPLRPKLLTNDYDYLATLSHVPPVVSPAPTELEDATYYLEQAKQAKDRRNWAAVEVFYQLAWKALPPERRRAAIANWKKPDNERNSSNTKSKPATPKAKSQKNTTDF